MTGRLGATGLIVEMPPRHGKSELCSHYFPVWFLDLWPNKRVMFASYEADFAASWGRKVRNTIQEHQDKLRVRLADDSTKAARWDTTQGGGMVTAGVGGPITGRGADLLIIDDPVKNAEEANSPTYRQKVWEWWTSTARTRLEPGGVVVLVMTRWHVDDLAGRIIQNMEAEGEKWKVIRFPAIAEEEDELGRKPGEALWPERYDEQALDRIRRSVGSYVWSALYQQDPKNREGGMFRREWFKIVDDYPADCRKVRYWDLAATKPKQSSDPDYTAGALVGEKNGIYYIIDIRRARETPANVERLIRLTAELDGPTVDIYMEQEPGSSGVSTIDHYAREVLKGFAFRGHRVTGPKELRANPLSAAAEAGNVMLVRGPWIQDFLDEAEAFPHGAHDDQVDAVSGAFEMLTKRKPKPGIIVI